MRGFWPVFALAWYVSVQGGVKTYVLPTESPNMVRARVELARSYVNADIAIEKTIARAVNAYTKDHHKYPADAKQLVPDYLPDIPIVPGSPEGSRFRYLLIDPPLQLGAWVILDDASLDLETADLVKNVYGHHCDKYENVLAFWQRAGVTCGTHQGINN